MASRRASRAAPTSATGLVYAPDEHLALSIPYPGERDAARADHRCQQQAGRAPATPWWPWPTWTNARSAELAAEPLTLPSPLRGEGFWLPARGEARFPGGMIGRAHRIALGFDDDGAERRRDRQ